MVLVSPHRFTSQPMCDIGQRYLNSLSISVDIFNKNVIIIHWNFATLIVIVIFGHKDDNIDVLKPQPGKSYFCFSTQSY